MPSRTSLVSKTLFWKNFGRYAPLWAIFLGILLMSGPVALLQSRALILSASLLDGRGVVSLDARTEILQGYVLAHSISDVLINLVYAMLCAALLFHYLHSRRTAYMMHAFPLNRSTLFCTNLLSGLFFALIPYTVQTLLSVLVAIGLPGIEQLLLLYVVNVLSFLFFFGLAVFCMLLSGRTVISILSYLALNLIGWVLPALCVATLSLTSFGIPLSVAPFTFLSPVIRLIELQVGGMFEYELEYVFNPEVLVAAGCYALVGAGLLFCAWLHYRVRQIEEAGEAMAYRWARLAFLILFTAVCTLGIGLILTLVFSVVNISAGARPNLAVMIPAFCVGALLGYFAAQMMLKRTVKVFQAKNWGIYGLIVVGIAAVLLCVRFDVLGIQRYIPEQSAISSVTVTAAPSDGGYAALRASVELTDASDLEAMRKEHDKAYYNWNQNTGSAYSGREVTVTYKLKNGGTVERTFLINNAKTLDLKAFSDPEQAVAYYDSVLTKTTPSYVYMHKQTRTSSTTYTCTKVYKLRDAILQDAAEGNLPIAGFLTPSDGPYELYYGNMYLNLPETAVNTLALFTEDESPVWR